MTQKTPPKLTPYWTRLAAEAETILERRIATVSARTVPPEWCLRDTDAWRMEKNRGEIAFYTDMRDVVKRGGFWGRVVAFDTVWGENPARVFRPR